MKLAPLALGLALAAGLVAAVLLLSPERAPRAASAGPAAADLAFEGFRTDAVVEPVSAPAASGPVRAAPTAEPEPPARVPRLATVVDTDDAPIAGARVRLFASAEDEELLAEGLTDAEGRATLVPARDLPERVLVEASAEGFAPRSYTRNPAGPIEVRLRWMTVAHGRVLDDASGAAIAGATVAWEGRVVESAADGSYRIELPAGAGVDVAAAGYLRRSVLVPERGPRPVEHDLELRRRTVVHVRVVDRRTGLPLDRVRTSDGEVGLDAEGRLALALAAGIGFDERIDAEGYASFRLRWLVTEPELLEGARVPMLRPSWIEGRVTDARGGPIEGAWVDAWVESMGKHLALDSNEMQEHGLLGSCSYEFAGRASTGGDGSFRTEVLARAEPYTLVGGHKLYTRSSVAPLHVDEVGQRLRADLVLSLAGTVAGTVTLNGEPWSGRVEWKRDDGADVYASNGVHLDAEGRYEVKNLTAGTIELRLLDYPGPPADASAIVQVVAGRTVKHDFDLELPRAPLAGRVVDHQGRAVRGETVRAYGGAEGRSLQIFSTHTANDGGFRMEVDQALEYLVSAGEGPRSARVDEVAAGSEEVLLTLREVGTLRFRLVDAESGRPVHPSPAISVLTQHLGPSWRPAGTKQYRSIDPRIDADVATFELPPGRVDITLAFRELDYAPLVLRDLQVVAGDPPPMTVELTPALELLMTLEDPHEFGRQVGVGHDVVVLLEQSQLDDLRETDDIGIRDPTLLRQVPNFDASGRAWLRGLAPGTYSLRAFPDDLVFEPASFELDDTVREVTLRWRVR